MPTRITHWTIVILFGICWWTAESDHMKWHLFAGYGVLAAVWFRLGWGFCGGETSRFRNFIRTPSSTFGYARKLLCRDSGDSPAHVGHNPLGALSIVAMLGLLLTQTTFGLFAINVDGFNSGPLSRWVSYETGRRFAHWHAASFDLLLALIAVHLTAISFYRFIRKEPLVPAMIHGHKTIPRTARAPFFVPWWRAALLATVILASVAWLARFH